MLGISESSPLDLRWRLFGIPIRIQASFWLFCVLLGWPHVHRAEWARFGLLIACLLISFLWKELGQVIVGRLFGVRGGIVLYAFGGGAVGDFAAMRRWQRLVFHAVGPACSLILWQAGYWAPRYLNLANLGGDNALFVVTRLYQFNLLWTLLHLLPIYPLDGGMMVRDLLEWAVGRAGLMLSLFISLACAGGMAVWAGYLWWTGRRGEWYFGEPFFSMIFEGLLALQSMFLLLQALRRPPTEQQTADAHEMDQYRRT